MSLSREAFEEIKKLSLFKGKVVSGSMDPVIKIGEEVVVEVGQKDLKRFDIIVIYQNERLICHYLWNINRIMKPLLMQTRNIQGQKDFPVGEEDYLGKVISHKIGFFRKLKLLRTA